MKSERQIGGSESSYPGINRVELEADEARRLFNSFREGEERFLDLGFSIDLFHQELDGEIFRKALEEVSVGGLPHVEFIERVISGRNEVGYEGFKGNVESYSLHVYVTEEDRRVPGSLWIETFPGYLEERKWSLGGSRSKELSEYLDSHPEIVVSIVEAYQKAKVEQDPFRVVQGSREREHKWEIEQFPFNTSIVGSTFFPDYKLPENREYGSLPKVDNIRGDLVLETVRRLQDQGVRIHIVDGGSSEEFLEKIKKLDRRAYDASGNVTTYGFLKDAGPIFLHEQIKPGYSNARVEALRSVLIRNPRAKVLLMMELEKVDLADQLKRLTGPILNGDADVVIPDRGVRVRTKDWQTFKEAYRGYPEVQARSEAKANFEINEILKDANLLDRLSPLDLFGGTRVIRNDKELLRLFGEQWEVPTASALRGVVRPEVYSQAVYFPVYLALASGYKVESVPLRHFRYPSEQEAIEVADPTFEEKRRQQYEDIVNGSRIFIEYLKDNRHSTGRWLKWLNERHPDVSNLRWSESENQISQPIPRVDNDGYSFDQPYSTDPDDLEKIK